MNKIQPPHWHPVQCAGFILDWDGVLADTKLDFSEIRSKYFQGRPVPLLEGMAMFSEKRVSRG